LRWRGDTEDCRRAKNTDASHNFETYAVAKLGDLLHAFRDHIDYLVNGPLHHPHGDHCDDHGPLA
jgi:hypothetical protein